jgi:transposase-like protein
LGTTTLFSPEKSENESMFLSKMRRSFTVAQKLKILNECENYSYREVSIKHSIHLSMLYKWQLVKDKLLTTNKRLVGSGRKAMHPVQEEQLFNKLKEWRKDPVA